MKRNLRLIGRNFEQEALEILKKEFDSIEWLSENKHSSFDFKCIKGDRIYFGDAKLLSKGKKPMLRVTQRSADFIIAKINGEVKMIWKKDFKNNINIQKGLIPIELENETYRELFQRKKAGESFDEVINRMILEEPEAKRSKK